MFTTLAVNAYERTCPNGNILDYVKNSPQLCFYNLIYPIPQCLQFLNHEIFFLLFISHFTQFFFLSYSPFIVLILLRFNMCLPPTLLNLTLAKLPVYLNFIVFPFTRLDLL